MWRIVLGWGRKVKRKVGILFEVKKTSIYKWKWFFFNLRFWCVYNVNFIMIGQENNIVRKKTKQGITYLTCKKEFNTYKLQSKLKKVKVSCHFDEVLLLNKVILAMQRVKLQLDEIVMTRNAYNKWQNITKVWSFMQRNLFDWGRFGVYLFINQAWKKFFMPRIN